MDPRRELSGRARLEKCGRIDVFKGFGYLRRHVERDKIERDRFPQVLFMFAPNMHQCVSV